MPSSASDIPEVDPPTHHADPNTRDSVAVCLARETDLANIVTEIYTCIRATPMDGWRLVQIYYHTLNQEMRRQCWDNAEIKQAFEEVTLLAAKNLQGYEMYRIWQVANLYDIDLIPVLFEKVGEMFAMELRQAISSGNTDRVNDVLTFIQQPNNGLSKQIYVPQLANGLRGIFDSDEQYAQAIASGIMRRFMRSYGYSANMIRNEFNFVSDSDLASPHLQAALTMYAGKYRNNEGAPQYINLKNKLDELVHMHSVDANSASYSIEKLDDVHQLLIALGAWEHPTALALEIQGAILDGVELGNDPLTTLQNLCRYYATKPHPQLGNSLDDSSLAILNRMPLISEVEQQENITRINTLQNIRLRHAGMQTVSEKDMHHRALVLYYRSRAARESMDTCEFLIALYATQMYLKSGRAQVFNQIRIVSRDAHAYPATEISRMCPEAKYIDASGEDFYRICNIGSVPVFMTHGKPPHAKYSSISILGAAIRMNAEKMQSASPHVDMRCDWDQEDAGRQRTRMLNEPNYAGSIPGIMYEMVRCIKAAEDMMLADAGLPPRTSPPEVTETVAQ